ncbi:MAG: hypothetical protein QM753_11150 [Thermomicrobiales bacterium]
MMSAFSVFTHLLPEETYLYLQDAHRALRPGGLVIMSFLEFACPGHWEVFQATVEGLKTNTRLPLNTFLSREAITTFSSRLGYACRFVAATEAPWQAAGPLGQSVAILRKS